VLALLHGQSLPDDVPIIAEIDDPSTAESLESAFGGRVTVVNPTSFIARTAAQVCRDAGVAHAYLELLGFAGSELYAHAVPEAIGRPYGELLPAFTDACVVGLVHADGGSDLNPPMGTVVADGDRVLVVAEDETSITFDAAQPPVTSPALPAAPPPPPERVVIFGWNELAPRIVTELSAYLTEGSRITVVCDPDHTVEDAPGADDVAPCDLEVRMAEGRELLDVIESEQPDHAMVLCYRDGLSPAEADARALVTTLQIRNAIAHQPRETTVVTELLDQRDVALAPPAAAGDFLVSDRLISLLLTQLSEDVRLKPVFDDLLDESGAELYCKPIDRYCQPGTPTTFQQLVVAASRRSESAIGYRRRDLAHDRGARFGIVVNPPKSASLTLVAGDELIVVAEDGR
jgi:ion channel POLLUX/CASTOR